MKTKGSGLFTHCATVFFMGVIVLCLGSTFVRAECTEYKGTLQEHTDAGRAVVMQDGENMPKIFFAKTYPTLIPGDKIGVHPDAVAIMHLNHNDGGYRPGPCPPDIDDDTYLRGHDCNDINPDIYPRAEEICGDRIDQDCDGMDQRCEPPYPCRKFTTTLEKHILSGRVVEVCTCICRLEIKGSGESIEPDRLTYTPHEIVTLHTVDNGATFHQGVCDLFPDKEAPDHEEKPAGDPGQ